LSKKSGNYYFFFNLRSSFAAIVIKGPNVGRNQNFVQKVKFLIKKFDEKSMGKTKLFGYNFPFLFVEILDTNRQIFVEI